MPAALVDLGTLLRVDSPRFDNVKQGGCGPVPNPRAASHGLIERGLEPQSAAWWTGGSWGLAVATPSYRSLSTGSVAAT